MFTQNYINLQKVAFMGGTATFKYQDGTTGTPAVSLQSILGLRLGEAMQVPKCANPSDTFTNSVYFGSGSTPATKDDFTLEAPITSGLSFAQGTSLCVKTQDGQYAAWVSHVVKNTTSNVINIYEIGLFAQIYNAGNTTSTKYVLMERTVLDEPIVIPAGEEKTVTYKLTFNQ